MKIYKSKVGRRERKPFVEREWVKGSERKRKESHTYLLAI
jgi:hypothetical protein